MSAFLCNDYHISMIAAYAVRRGFSKNKASDLARAMQDENHTALYFRYDDAPRHLTAEQKLVYDRRAERTANSEREEDLMQVYKAFVCFNYQCWEHEAYTNQICFISQLVHTCMDDLINKLHTMYGYGLNYDAIAKTALYNEVAREPQAPARPFERVEIISEQTTALI